MYTPGQVSAMLDIPPSTLRRLSHEFAAFLDKTPGRHRRYSEQDINTLRQVRSKTGQGMTVEVIRLQLPIVEAQPPAGDSLALVPTVAAELSRLENYSRSILSELDTLRSAWKEDHVRLDRLAAWVALPWWKRLFTPPPK